MTSQHPIYVIVGPPRSGTSALAWALRDQGINMFMNADQPDLDSPSGNQEDNLLRIVNNFLMSSEDRKIRRNWDSPTYVPGSPEKAVRLIQSYIRFRARNAVGPWGMKDPRMCFLLEPWHAATLGLPIQWIYIHRHNREAMVDSLSRMLTPKLRYSLDRAGVHRLSSYWAESYHLACELGFARTMISPYRITYEELLTADGKERLKERFGFKKTIHSVKPQLNRHCHARVETGIWQR